MAEVFNASDLKWTDYKWKALADHDDPRYTGKPDSTMLNKTEGYEMLYFIRKYMTDNSLKQVTSGQKVEKLIRESKEADKSHKFWREYITKNW